MKLSTLKEIYNWSQYSRKRNVKDYATAMAVLSVASPLLLVLANFLFAHQNPHNFFSFMGLGALGLFCFLMTFFAAGTFLFSLISIIKLSFNKLSDSEFLVNETLFKDNLAP